MSHYTQVPTQEFPEAKREPPSSPLSYFNWQRVQLFIIFSATLCVGFYCGMLVKSTPKAEGRFGAYETGFRTEGLCKFGCPDLIESNILMNKVLPHLIQLELKTFSGNVRFLENGTEVLVLDPNDTVYVGEPTKAIDRAWDELLEGRYFSISEEEAQLLWGDSYEVYRDQKNGGFTGG